MELVPISRAALGSSAQLGDLYDARRDIFCGISIFKRNIPEDALQLTDSNFSDVQLQHSDDFSEKVTKLDVSAQLSVSVLGGLFKLEGSARFLCDQKQSARSVKSSLIYSIKTKDESVNIFHEELNDAFAIYAIESGMATHVVVGISWGANLILSCMYQNRDNRDVRNIAGNLSAKLKMVACSVSGSASVEVEEEDNSTNESFDIRLYGDVLAENEELPTRFEGALELMKKLPGLVAGTNDGKGKPLSYKLLPIALLQDYLKFEIQADKLLQSLEEASLIRIVKFFDQFTAAQQLVHDFFQDAVEFSYCVDPDVFEEISQLKDELTIEETSFRSQLADALTQVRSGKAEVSTLETLLERFQDSDISPQKIQAKLAQYGFLVKKMNFARSLKENGAKYIGLGNSLDDELLCSFEEKVYILFFSEESKLEDADQWKGNRQLFFQELKKKEEGHTYLVVDCDIHPDQKRDGLFSCIQIHNSGKIIVENLLEEQVNAAPIPYVQYIAETERDIYRPSNRVPLTIPCTGQTCNPDSCYEWKCISCKTTIDYGFDDHVYCKCGKTPAQFLQFRCTDPDHGLDYQVHEEEFFLQLLGRLRTFRETNILILGETGVGKSLFINQFLNLLNHETLEEAKEGELRTLIPSEFTMCDEAGEEVPVSIGEDKNECQQEGQSTTQSIKVYPFRIGNRTVRFIDTPGFGDIRGTEQDMITFENILATLSYLDELHGIVIFLKPSNSRLKVVFKYCLSELLKHLSDDANKIVTFCFTHTRETFYQPGDTLFALKKRLEANEDIGISVNPNTVYCLDSEGYKFLAALKNDPPLEFSDEQAENFAASWDYSMSELKRLLEHIWSIEPYQLLDTLNVYQTRQSILTVAQLLADVNNELLQNILAIKREIKTFNDTEAEIDEDCPELIAEKLEELKEKIQAKHEQMEEFENELQTILYDYIKFICLLNNNAIIQYTDAVQNCLEKLIQEEEASVDEGTDSGILDYLVEKLDSYKNQKCNMESYICDEYGGAIDNGMGIFNDHLQYWETYKHCGKSLEDAITFVEDGGQAYSEVVSPALLCPDEGSSIKTWLLQRTKMA